MLTDYCGAGSRLSPERGLALDANRWGWQPKIDGTYARVSLDRRGRIANVLARSGSPIAEARDLVGILAGPPDSVLHAEFEAHTEAGNRLSSLRGWRALHVFDATRLNGSDVSRSAYLDRYDGIRQAHDHIASAGTTNPWVDDDQGDAHDARTGRYCARVPRDIRRVQLVPLERNGSELWRSHVELAGGEGLVAVRLDAPAGARGAKRKIKATDTLDCAVVAIGGGAARLTYGGHTFTVSARGKWSALAVGSVVEVAADGWYESSSTPRFARIVRVRHDLHA